MRGVMIEVPRCKKEVKKKMKKIHAAFGIGMIALLFIGMVSAVTPSATDIPDESSFPIDDVMDNLVILPTSPQPELEEVRIGPDMMGLKCANDQAAIEVIEFGGHRSFPFSDFLKGDNHNLHGTFAWTEGQRVHISIQWTPPDQNIYYGILDRNNREGIIVPGYGGSGSHTFSVPWPSDDWAVIVWNPPGNKEIYYSGSLTEQ